MKVSGDDISFIEPLKFEDQEISITYKGTVAGDEMKLTRQVGDFATEELVAKRAQGAGGATPGAGQVARAATANAPAGNPPRPSPILPAAGPR